MPGVVPDTVNLSCDLIITIISNQYLTHFFMNDNILVRQIKDSDWPKKLTLMLSIYIFFKLKSHQTWI